jgi:hypothetical protein
MPAMSKKRSPKIEDAVLESFPVILAARRVVERRRRHGRRALAAAGLSIAKRAAPVPDAAPHIGDAVLCDD